MNNGEEEDRAKTEYSQSRREESESEKTPGRKELGDMIQKTYKRRGVS